MVEKKLRWGILGTGAIAHQFAKGLQDVPDAQLVAVGSRAEETANRFGDRFSVQRRHNSYEGLVADDEVDVVYIASPHSLHKANAILALEAGKAVLCEKPFTINADELRDVIDVAQSKNLFLMEAMWTRCFPIMDKVRTLVADGAIGTIDMLAADFGFREPFDAESRVYDPRFGGGALLDVGVYALSFASMLLGKPARIAGLAQLGPSDVDHRSGYLLAYDAGPLAVLYAAVATDSPQEATVMGSEGMIRIQSPWWQPCRMILIQDGNEQIIEAPYLGNGYCHEAMEVGRCLAKEETESPLMPLDESLEIMDTMDALRSQWGLRYPME